jgi:hypothetical protein
MATIFGTQGSDVRNGTDLVTSLRAGQRAVIKRLT